MRPQVQQLVQQEEQEGKLQQLVKVPLVVVVVAQELPQDYEASACFVQESVQQPLLEQVVVGVGVPFQRAHAVDAVDDGAAYSDPSLAYYYC